MASLSNTRLQQLLEPGAQALGFEILAVELAGRAGSTILRVYIDRPDGVTVNDCARVSQQLSAILDIEDPIPETYALEVSSPGLDRPLTKRKHFEDAVGREVKIQTRSHIAGRRRFTGVLRQVMEEILVVDVDGEPYDLPMIEIERARLVSKV